MSTVGAVVVALLAVAVVGFMGLFVSLKMLTFIIALREITPVRFLAPAPTDDPDRARLTPVGVATTPRPEPTGEFNPYASPKDIDYPTGQNQAAQALGFAGHGLYVHSKGGTYKLHYAPWISPDHRTLALVVWGTIARINVRKTLLYSRLQDGRFLITCDKLPGNDTPGLFEILVVKDAPFEALVTRHDRRLAAATSPVVPFEGIDAKAEYEAIVARRYEYLVGQKKEFYLDSEKTAVRSTLKGALLLALQWKVPSYVEHIPSPGAEPVPSFKKKQGPAALRYADGFFTIVIIVIFALSYFYPALTARSALFQFGITVFCLLGLLLVWLIRMAMKFRKTH